MSSLDVEIDANFNGLSSSKRSKVSQNRNVKEANAIDKKLINSTINKTDGMLFLNQGIKN